jgi:DNA-directed RNA polymerase specialized sigma24 family protein
MTPVFDWYQYFFRTPDADVIRYLKVFSMKSLDEIAAATGRPKSSIKVALSTARKSMMEQMKKLK